MALSAANKADVRRYLGYPDINRDAHSALEGALVALSAEGETVVTGLLSQLGTIDTQLQSSWSRQKVKRAEEVTLAGHDEIMALRQEGNRLAATIGTVFGVTPVRLPFAAMASAGPTGRG